MTNTNPNSVSIYGARGGVGTSVTAAIMASTLLDYTVDARVSLIDVAMNGGFMAGETDRAVFETRKSQVRGYADKFVTIHDCGIPTRDTNFPSVLNYMVVRADYVGLRSVQRMNAEFDLLSKIDALIVVREDGRSLDMNDVSRTTGLKSIYLPWDISIARSADAGLLSSRGRTKSVSFLQLCASIVDTLRLS